MILRWRRLCYVNCIITGVYAPLNWSTHRCIARPQDPEGNTALHLAISRSDPDLVRELASQGAPVNAQNEDGDTALHLAYRQFKGNAGQFVRALREFNADETLKNAQDQIPADAATAGPVVTKYGSRFGLWLAFARYLDRHNLTWCCPACRTEEQKQAQLESKLQKKAKRLALDDGSYSDPDLHALVHKLRVSDVSLACPAQRPLAGWKPSAFRIWARLLLKSASIWIRYTI